MRRLCLALILGLAAGAAAADEPPRTAGQATVLSLAPVLDIANSPAKVTVSGASARTATDVPAGVTVRVICDVDTYVNFGTSSVTATTGEPLLIGGMPEVFNMGTAVRVAFITSGASGSCWVTVLR